MYSESDLEAAVAAGAITADAAAALRAHVAATRETPVVDEEHFRLLTGFNDIFVTIAGIILLVSVAGLGRMAGAAAGLGSSPLSGLAVAAVAWGLAEYFTRQRRMALPSIMLLLAFSGGVYFGLLSLAVSLAQHVDDRAATLAVALSALPTAFATWLHWRRFMVPITVAVGAAALAAVAVGLAAAAVPRTIGGDAMFWFVLPAGLAIFAFAMWWDMSDRTRQTRRSDVAFWLHLTAAPMIAHSLFQLVGVFGSDAMGAGKAVAVLLLYGVFGLVALAIDRRALLVSSLAYVLYAMYALLDRTDAAFETSAALTALVIGSALLLLSAFWQNARRRVVGALPADLAARLPVIDRPAPAAAT